MGSDWRGGSAHAGTSGIEPGQIVAALPISGAYAEFVCLPQSELVPVPSGLDAAEAVSLVLNYVTAYQMLHRSAKVRRGQRALIHKPDSPEMQEQYENAGLDLMDYDKRWRRYWIRLQPSDIEKNKEDFGGDHF